MKHYRLFATLALALAPGCNAQEVGEKTLGRLFFTPQQRSERAQRGAAENAPNEQRQTLDGEVRRSSGKHTHWINGQASHDQAGSTPQLGVGDSYLPRRKVRESLLGDGRIEVRPASSAQ